MSAPRLSVNIFEKKQIAPDTLRPSTFPNDKVYLMMTKSCSKMTKIIGEYMKSEEYSQGVVGPSGMGKSYALLHNYIILYQSDKYTVLYINNPEDLLSDPLYIFNEISYCLTPMLREDLDSYMGLIQTITNEMNYQNSRRYITDMREGTVLTEEQVPRLLWAITLCTKEDKAVDMEMLCAVLALLRDYCTSINRKFILLFDQFHLLYQKKAPSENIKKWREIVLGPKKLFTKVVWVASTYHDFDYKGLKYQRWVYFYDTMEIYLALQKHMSIMKNTEIREFLQANIQLIVAFIKHHTDGHPWEVNRLLNYEGIADEEKQRVKELFKDFYASSLNKNFKPDIFFALIMINDFMGDIEDYLSRDIFRNVFEQVKDKAGKTLMYFDEEKGTFHSPSDIARKTVFEIIIEECKKIYDICETALKLKKYKDPKLNEHLQGHLAMTRVIKLIPF